MGSEMCIRDRAGALPDFFEAPLGAASLAFFLFFDSLRRGGASSDSESSSSSLTTGRRFGIR